MKALGLIALVSLIGYFILMFVRQQDLEYNRYSNRAKTECKRNIEKVLVFDNDLRYYKCVQRGR